MRKKMMKNDMFYIHYPFRPDPNVKDSRDVSVTCKVYPHIL